MTTEPVKKGTRRVVVVTGGAAGIGAAIAEEFGRSGAFVVTMDPVVSPDGSKRILSPMQTTAQRIIEAGGTARASDTSVTDQEAVRALFNELVEEFGALDSVVNVAGITRLTGFATGLEEDWTALLDVHLNGYINVLRAALPIMAKAGHGRILGVTSGSGWRPANIGAYSCAKRAVAALTWQIGAAAPPGVTVNAFSPIADTRRDGRPRVGDQRASMALSGGLDVGSKPPPEMLGPIGAYLAGDEFSWCSGQVIFSGGSELAWILAPRLIETVRSADATSLPHVLRTIVPVAIAPAEAAQSTNGGSNPRFGGIFEEPEVVPGTRTEPARSCVIVTDDGAWGAVISDALLLQGVESVKIGTWPGAQPGTTEIGNGFAGTSEKLNRAAHESGPIDAVVVVLVGTAPSTTSFGGWQQILDEHAAVSKDIYCDASWARAVSDYSALVDRPVRLVTVTDATTSGGKTRAQAAAQLARAAHMATSDRVDAFAISVETRAESERRSIADLVAHLVCHPDAGDLSGAELMAASGWFGLRSHPSPAATISYGGPEVPGWLDGALRQVILDGTS